VVKLHPSWLAVVEDEFEKPYMAALRSFLVEEKARHRVYPPGGEIFRAFDLCPFDRARVVVLGQDPYHGPSQAHGLCFSVRRGVPPPPSLANIYKELRADLGVDAPDHGELTAWAEQGVLLLNTVLTVREHTANSHRGKGWETFTDRVIAELNARRDGLVFVLWGAAAGAKASAIDGRRHLILRSAHPSPLSAHNGFFGSRPFSRINAHLRGRGEPEIDWRLPR
jgi:uracil-DNA glycosylase